MSNAGRRRAVWKKLKTDRFSVWTVSLVIALILYAALINTALPGTVNVKLHDIAKHDIQSPIEIVDKESTEALRKQAMANTPTSYVYNRDAALIQVEKADDFFDVIDELRTARADADSSKAKKTADFSQQLKTAKDRLKDSTARTLSDDTLKTLLSASDHDVALARDLTSSAIYEAMSDKVKWADLESAQNKAIRSIPASVVSDGLQAALEDLLRAFIVPNYVFDAQATKRSKEDAARSVDPVVIRQGEVIVKKGELITRDVLHKLEVVGLTHNHFKVLPFFGLLILVAFLTAFLAMELNRAERSGRAPSKFLYLYASIFTVAAVLLKLGSLVKVGLIPEVGFAMPVASGPLLMMLLLNQRIAIATSVVLSVAGGFMYGDGVASSDVFDYAMALYILASGLAGASMGRAADARPKFLTVGAILAATDGFVVLLLLLLKNGAIHPLDAGIQLGCAVLSAFLSTVLAVGLMPFFEAVFGILSPMKLIELSNPNHPLLRKILLEAPGTYHHSLMVANLAERACEAIGANGLLARVAAYYHDIGKTKRPQYFIENQMHGVNPHDKLSPQLSKKVIIAHPYDGADMLRAHKMPKEIVEIAESHHGTTLLKYFYQKAKEMQGDVVQENDFRYPGPKVKSKEAAVVELADSVEAAVRAMKHPTPEKIEQTVQAIFNDRLQDGQFDECDLTMREWHEIKRAICETLNGVFHSRIEYPEELGREKNKKREARLN